MTGRTLRRLRRLQLARWFPPRLQCCKWNGVDEGEEHRLLVPQHVDDVRVGVYPVPKVEDRLRSADALRVCAERPTLGHKIEKSEAGSSMSRAITLCDLFGERGVLIMSV